MKNSKDQILAKAKKVLQDIKGEYYKEEDIVKITYRANDNVARPKGKVMDTWVISIDSIFDNRDFLTVSDETGEPLYYQNFNTVIAEITKDSNGKYVAKKH